MTAYEAPAKLNLALHVFPPSDGMHPLESIVQTIEWCDRLEVVPQEEWSFSVEGADIDTEDNLVVTALRSSGVDRAGVSLTKAIPVGAGLGGGSSDAAAALLAAVDLGRLDPSELRVLAAGLGADVTMFIEGGTQLMTGTGETVSALRAVNGLHMAVVVPEFALSTSEVYARWDALEGPIGEAIPDERLPPQLRDGMPIRNDLLPAALSIEPGLGDFMSDVRRAWDIPVLLTGSGSGCFGFFPSQSEAIDAAAAVAGARAARGVGLRDRGIARVGF